MIEVADILRLHGPAYQAHHPLLPSQRKALEDLVRCRTAALGGHVYACDQPDCDYQQYSYHSCGNRHCPKCHGEQTERWLEKQTQRLLPCAFYFVTVTLPAEFRSLVFAHQKELYGLLLSSAAATLQRLAWDPQWVGGQLAILALLHTWTQDLRDHPHAHLLVSAGGLSRDGHCWVPPRHPAFLMPGYALSAILKAQFKARLKKLGWLNQIAPTVWQKPWKNVQIQHAGRGDKVLDYLGRYAFRIALTNSRLEAFENGQVTFGYRDRKTRQKKQCTLSAEQFIGRFLRHVLPKGFVKIRSYGLWSSSQKERLQKAQTLLAAQGPPLPATSDLEIKPQPGPLPEPQPCCPKCKVGHLICIATLLPERPRAP